MLPDGRDERVKIGGKNRTSPELMIRGVRGGEGSHELIEPPQVIVKVLAVL